MVQQISFALQNFFFSERSLGEVKIWVSVNHLEQVLRHKHVVVNLQIFACQQKTGYLICCHFFWSQKFSKTFRLRLLELKIESIK